MEPYFGTREVAEWTKPVWINEYFIDKKERKVNACDKGKKRCDRLSRKYLGKEEDVEHAQGCRQREQG
jgi:hypothetical protein